MYRYGKVIFGIGGEEGARLQKTLISRMNVQGVITVPTATIEKWYEEDKMEQYGCIHSYALHDQNETDIFKTIMESKEMQSEYVKWMITRHETSRKFRNWVKEVERKNNFK